MSSSCLKRKMMRIDLSTWIQPCSKSLASCNALLKVDLWAYKSMSTAPSPPSNCQFRLFQRQSKIQKVKVEVDPPQFSTKRTNHATIALTYSWSVQVSHRPTAFQTYVKSILNWVKGSKLRSIFQKKPLRELSAVIQFSTSILSRKHRQTSRILW